MISLPTVRYAVEHSRITGPEEQLINHNPPSFIHSIWLFCYGISSSGNIPVILPARRYFGSNASSRKHLWPPAPARPITARDLHPDPRFPRSPLVCILRKYTQYIPYRYRYRNTPNNNHNNRLFPLLLPLHLFFFPILRPSRFSCLLLPFLLPRLPSPSLPLSTFQPPTFSRRITVSILSRHRIRTLLLVN